MPFQFFFFFFFYSSLFPAPPLPEPSHDPDPPPTADEENEIDLATYFSDDRRFSHRNSGHAAVLIAAATHLAAIHADGRAHGGICPANIVMTQGDPMTTRILGDPDGSATDAPPGLNIIKAYASPEDFEQRGEPTIASDAYSFALVLYRTVVVAGSNKSMPSAKDRQGGASLAPWEVAADLPDVGGWFGTQMRRSLATDPANRPPVSDWIPILRAVQRTRKLDCARFWGLCAVGMWDEALAAQDGVDLLRDGSTFGSHVGNALHFVAWSDDAPLEMVAKCVDSGCDINAFAVATGPPISHAARPAMAAELLAHDANVAATDPMGATPLLHAARAGQICAVRALLEAGADPASADPWGGTAIDWLYGGGGGDDGVEAEDLAMALLDAGVVPGDFGAVVAMAREAGHDRVTVFLEGAGG